jgi:hypothetical protein
MNPLKVSAQYAAYVWYSETKRGTATHDEAVRFARENWVPFLGCAHEGWGRLLIRVAKADAAGSRRRPRRRTATRPVRGMAEAS